MHIETQVVKHLPRSSKNVSFIDEYCHEYRDLFAEIRSYECFKYLHLGTISPISRKSLPAIAKLVGVSPQSLHHFIAESPWSAKKIRDRRLEQTIKMLQGKAIVVIINEAGNRKEGNKTDYVARQYLGSIDRIDNGIVSVNAYGVYQDITFPLIWKIFKPRETLKEGDGYKTKIELAQEIIKELVELPLNINLVLADSLYGESSDFIQTLENFNLSYIMGVSDNHGVWLLPGKKLRSNKWHEFKRITTHEKIETRFTRQIIMSGDSRTITYWEITTDPKTLPKKSISFVMTNIQGRISKMIGNFYGSRTWEEYGFREVMQGLGWTDYRFTKFAQIEKWWELICSAYLMVSLSSPAFLSLTESSSVDAKAVGSLLNFSSHQQWHHASGWKNCLNNLRLQLPSTTNE